MEELDYSEILELNICLSHVKNKGISAEGIVDLVKLKIEVKNALESHGEMRKAVMEKYDVKAEGASYNFSKHPEADAIRKDIEAIDKSKVKMRKLKFLTMNEIVSATPEVNADIIAVLFQKLAKDYAE
jgi:hypothetical protein